MPSSANRLAISHTSLLRFFLSDAIESWSTSLSTSTFCTADVVLVELLVRVVDAALGDIEADGVIPAHDLGIPLGVSTVSSTPSI